jgi:hypothetical protein
MMCEWFRTRSVRAGQLSRFALERVGTGLPFQHAHHTRTAPRLGDWRAITTLNALRAFEEHLLCHPLVCTFRQRHNPVNEERAPHVARPKLCYVHFGINERGCLLVI